MVVVAGDEHDVAAREYAADGLEELAGLAERLADRTVAKLDDVAEQDQPLGAGAIDCLEEPLPHRRPAQNVMARAGAEVEVGYQDGDGHRVWILATPIVGESRPDHRRRGAADPE